MAESKQFKTYAQQLALLEQRGMTIEDPASAEALLRQLNYYRLSGYWHPMRRFDPATGQSLDEFRPGASFNLVHELYLFDEQLRHVALGSLARIELAVRALLGHELGAIDPFIHLKPELLGAPAHQVVSKQGDTRYEVWLKKYETALLTSREDFVAHHENMYGGKLPIWAAVEVMDWGTLSHLYGMAPGRARNPVADACGLRAPQLESWLKSLNIVRNYSAHHARLFNRVFDIKPRLSDDSRLAVAKGSENRVFTQLTLIQYLHHELNLSAATDLPALLVTYPENEIVPFKRIGALEGWQNSDLWSLR
ncbi:Abi family protein [Rarobacter incanus]|uniref:Abortive infection bacteriophage resistance protein n=1 Tax=Rarobacter incanus TaxID=153494 RepID=A0A542SN12_9MICO|nr:Abi family protein [Rarobacter incanus]TQK76016.1 abortive infection bacteriophage resistance protein [Rarobacter incanus]